MKENPTELLELHIKNVEESKVYTNTSETLVSYGDGYKNGLKRALELVKAKVEPGYVPDFMKW